MPLALRQPRNLLFRLLSTWPVEIICDVGAERGTETVALSAIRPPTRVLAFEADPLTFALLETATEKNQETVECFNLAVGSRTGPIHFHLTGTEAERAHRPGGSSMLKRSVEGRLIAQEIRTVISQGIRLDGFLSAPKYSTGDLALWIDVEGAAFEVILGMSGAAGRVRYVHVEVETQPFWKGQKLKSDVNDLMQSMGFTELAHGFGQQHDSLYVNMAKFSITRRGLVRSLAVLTWLEDIASRIWNRTVGRQISRLSLKNRTPR